MAGLGYPLPQTPLRQVLSRINGLVEVVWDCHLTPEAIGYHTSPTAGGW